MEELEREVCNLPLVFAEMFKDEVNASDENEIYNGVKAVIQKYAEDEKAMEIINEFTSVVSGGASLEEIIQIAKDEAENPTITSEVLVDNECKVSTRDTSGYKH